MNVHLRLALVVVVMLAGACATSAVPPTAPIPTLLPAPSTGQFWTRDGAPVPRDTIQIHDGPGHCGWEDLTFLSLPRVLGQRLTGETSRQFVRDPSNRFDERLVGRFEGSVLPPAEVTFTGYRFGDLALWLVPGDDRSVLIERRGIWERWPRVREREAFGCD